MLTYIRDFNHKVWNHSRVQTAIAILIGGSLFLLCGCAKQGLAPPTLTGAPLPTEAIAPTPATPPAPTSTPLPTPPPATGLAADLALQASEPVEIVPGETTIYTLTVRNHGPSTATSILFTDTLPNGLIPVWAQAAEPVCGRQGRSVSCNVGDLWAGDAVTFTLDLAAGGSAAPVTVTQLAGVTWDLSAPSCTIQDSTPPHVTCRLSDLQPGADAHLRIGVDAEAWITSLRLQTLVHTATVTANESDANLSNNRATFPLSRSHTAVTATAVPTIPATTDLVVQADGPLSVVAGWPFTYTFTISNQGTLDATDVSFESILPLATDLDACTPGLPLCEQQGETFTCHLRDPDSGESVTFTLVISGYAGQPIKMELDALLPGWPICTVLHERTYLHIVQCELGMLKPGQATHVQLTLVARGVRERTIVNTASTSANEADLNPWDNTHTATITVQTRADLAVWSALSGPAVAGEALSYTLTIANVGPSDAASVALTDKLPTGTRLVSAISSQGDECRMNTSTDTVSCGLSRLNAGETTSVTIVVAVDESLVPSLAEEIVHSARVESEQADPNPDNNELTESIPVSAGVKD